MRASARPSRNAPPWVARAVLTLGALLLILAPGVRLRDVPPECEDLRAMYKTCFGEGASDPLLKTSMVATELKDYCARTTERLKPLCR